MKNNIADVIMAASMQAKMIGRVESLKNLCEIIDKKRSEVVDVNGHEEYNRGYLDGLSAAYMAATSLARKELP